MALTTHRPWIRAEDAYARRIDPKSIAEVKLQGDILAIVLLPDGVVVANNPFHRPAGSGPSYSFTANGAHIFRFLALGTQTGGSYSAMEIVSPQCSGPRPHTHDESEEYFLLLDGRVAFIVGGEHYDVEPGGFVHVPRGIVHEFTVLTPTSRMIAMYSPGGPEAVFIEHGALMEPTGGRLSAPAETPSAPTAVTASNTHPPRTRRPPSRAARTTTMTAQGPRSGIDPAR